MQNHASCFRLFFLISKRRISNMRLESLKFDNLVLKRLPIDTIETNYVRTVNAACFSKVKPTPVKNPRLVAASADALSLLGLSKEESESKEFVEYFSGNKLLPGSEPAAHCYCGHQFGYFSGQLGDGAAIYLGEIVNEKKQRWEIQLKGAGMTPYSRQADGRKVLRSSVREFLCSEAMHFLNVPTTRAGACITSDSTVVRDIFYDGNPKHENCTIVLRIAPTFLRFGSFEIFKTLDPITGRVGPSVGRAEILYQMLDYAIETFYPDIHQQYTSEDKLKRYEAFFKEVVLRTARLVAHWQTVGFCHGVLNTDNMSILGLTIDYGPFGFLDMYDPNHICNASDDGGRYSFIKQPSICLWNLKKFAEAIQQALPLDVSSPLVELYEEEFHQLYMHKMRCKLGLISLELPDDKSLIEELLSTMEESGADFTNTFICLSIANTSDVKELQTALDRAKDAILENCYSLEQMKAYYKPDLSPAQIQSFKSLASLEPAVLDQLGRAGVAVRKVMAQLRKFGMLEEQTQKSKSEYDGALWDKWFLSYKDRIMKDFSHFQNDWSSYNSERMAVLQANNPKFILRNYLAQDAITEAEKGDFAKVKLLYDSLKDPYQGGDFQDIASEGQFEDEATSSATSMISKHLIANEKTPSWAFAIKVT